MGDCLKERRIARPRVAEQIERGGWEFWGCALMAQKNQTPV
jgi:hypothetical protein